MKKISISLTVAFMLVCVSLCGAWTTPAAAEAPVRYGGAQLISAYAADEIINYDTRTVVTNISTPNKVPLYSQIAGMENGCGATGGAIVVGYYDKYFPDMIPGWDSHYANGKYKIMVPQYVDPIAWDLYDRMRINVVAPGVSETEFKDGLKSYINDKGQNLSYEPIKSGGTFNISAYKTALNNKKPVVLFVQPSDLYYVTEYDGYDRIVLSTLSGNHIMVAYGYQDIRYTIGNTVRTDSYLLVATGFYAIGQAYYKVNSKIDSAYAVNVT